MGCLTLAPALAAMPPSLFEAAGDVAPLMVEDEREWQYSNDVRFDQLNFSERSPLQIDRLAWNNSGTQLVSFTAAYQDEPYYRGADGVEQDVQPNVLRAPEPVVGPPIATAEEFETEILLWETDPPLGFAGPSGVLPTESQESSHFVPVEDRWRIGFEPWDRYGRGNESVNDVPYETGSFWDPYNQHVLKGDYPIIGQHTFLNITANTQALTEFRQLPTPTTPFESTNDPFQEEFFGNPNQFFYTQFFRLTFDLFHGDAAFKPMDWRFKMTPVFNMNLLDVNELGIVNPNVLEGDTRFRTDVALEEWFFETKLADLSPDYDFLSVRAGSQFFVSDFRGFIFSDTNRAVRLFGTAEANRDQFNLIFFDQTEKETNSELNTFDDRHQNTLIANAYRQDFIWPGYTSQVSFHYNHDDDSMHFDENDFLARPDPVGVFLPHEIDSYYLGWAGDGHINRYNINHAFYYVFGEDELNPLAGHEVDIEAYMAAVELSYDRDWVRFRSSFFFASGDDDINDDKGEGFDSIFDNPNFAGGEFSFWQRQGIRLFGVGLNQRFSLVPDLRSSKTEGQTNFVNPGLFLVNFGMDFEVTPKLRLISNANYLWFAETEVLEQFVFQSDIDHEIGLDLSLGMEYRPLLNNNIIFVGGISGLLPGDGFKDIYNELDEEADGMFAAFLETVLTF